MSDPKPFSFPPPQDPRIGYSVTRRPDGGMHYVFTTTDHETLRHWREFALAHLTSADHKTRNLYDLRQVERLTPEALGLALEVGNDPAARNVRTAVVVSGPEVAAALDEVQAISEHGNFRVFYNLEEAEAWLTQPFSRLIKKQDALSA